MAREISVFFADIHCGHQFGLMPPDMELLDDSGPEPRVLHPQQTHIQQWVWPHYVNDHAAVQEIAGKSPVKIFPTGDITWGGRFPTQLVSTRMSDQLAIALRCLGLWYLDKNLKVARIMQGTESHEWGEGSAPILVSEQLARLYPKVNTRCVRHGRFLIQGQPVDVAHHGPGPGMREELLGNQLRLYTRSVMRTDLQQGKQPPVLLVRAHYHAYCHETVNLTFGDTEYKCEAYILPSYCGATHYAIQATKSAYMLACGMLVAEFVDGKLVGQYPLHRALDLRQEEAV